MSSAATIKIVGARVFDGTGSEAFESDVLVAGGVIRSLGHQPGRADREIDGRGRWLVPGFIDIHSHSEFSLLADGGGESKILQGVTTELVGNCGGSAFPLGGAKLARTRDQHPELDITWTDLPGYRRELCRRGHAPNLLTLTGQGNLRGSTIGYVDRPATPAEQKEMISILEAGLDAGSRGMSTGMPYPPGSYTPEAELVPLLEAVAARGGLWSTHMASEGDFLLEALAATIDLARRTGVLLQVSHLKASGEKNWGKMRPALEMIAAARAAGVEVACDRYPYLAGATDLDILLPAWAWEGGEEEELKRLASPEVRRRLLGELCSRDWQAVVIASAPGEGGEALAGKNLEELAAERGVAPPVALLDILLEQSLRVEAFFFGMSQENLDLVLAAPFSVLASDAAARPVRPRPGEGTPHPRAFGAFSRYLGRWVLSGRVEATEGISRLTGRPAAILGLADRGLIREGFAADLVLFDPRRFRDRADYPNPRCPPDGIEAVLVNGVPVALFGELTGARPGRFL